MKRVTSVLMAGAGVGGAAVGGAVVVTVAVRRELITLNDPPAVVLLGVVAGASVYTLLLFLVLLAGCTALSYTYDQSKSNN